MLTGDNWLRRSDDSVSIVRCPILQTNDPYFRQRALEVLAGRTPSMGNEAITFCWGTGQLPVDCPMEGRKCKYIYIDRVSYACRFFSGRRIHTGYKLRHR